MADRVQHRYEVLAFCFQFHGFIPSIATLLYLILLDDLDRIKPIRALELLEAIKNFLDAEKCVFILAVDYSVIEQGMVQKLVSRHICNVV